MKTTTGIGARATGVGIDEGVGKVICLAGRREVAPAAVVLVVVAREVTSNLGSRGGMCKGMALGGALGGAPTRTEQRQKRCWRRARRRRVCREASRVLRLRVRMLRAGWTNTAKAWGAYTDKGWCGWCKDKGWCVFVCGVVCFLGVYSL